MPLLATMSMEIGLEKPQIQETCQLLRSINGKKEPQRNENPNPKSHAVMFECLLLMK